MKLKFNYLLLIMLIFSSYLFTQITPNGKSVSSSSGSDLSSTDISAINYIVNNYYDVDVIQSSQANHGRFNCHFYAWNNAQGYGTWTQDYLWKNGQPSPLKWINYPTDYYTDQDYSQPSGFVSYISTTSNNAEICVYTSGGNITHSARKLSYSNKLISKWGAMGIYKHDPYECPDGRWVWSPQYGWEQQTSYGTITAYYRINPSYRPVGSGDPGGRNWGTISNALLNISPGSAITVFSGTQILTENITIPSDVTLKINSGATVNLNGYYLKCTGSGKIIKNGTINGYTSYAQSGSDYKGFFPASTTVQQILSWASSGWNIVLQSGTYDNSDHLTVNSGITLSINPGVTLKFASGKKLTINGTISANGTSSQKITFQANSGT